MLFILGISGYCLTLKLKEKIRKAERMISKQLWFKLPRIQETTSFIIKFKWLLNLIFQENFFCICHPKKVIQIKYYLNYHSGLLFWMNIFLKTLQINQKYPWFLETFLIHKYLGVFKLTSKLLIVLECWKPENWSCFRYDIPTQRRQKS